MNSYLINHHPGSVILFNLESATRLRAKDGTRKEKWKSTADMPLVVRLKYEEYSWLIGHRGHEEFVNSTIFARAMQNETKQEVVHLILRTWTKRKGDPITRAYELVFKSRDEAAIFVFAHNTFLTKEMEERAEEDDNKDKDGGNTKDGEEGEEEENVETGFEEEVEMERKLHVNGVGGEECFWEQEETQDPFADYISD